MTIERHLNQSVIVWREVGKDEIYTQLIMDLRDSSKYFLTQLNLMN